MGAEVVHSFYSGYRTINLAILAPMLVLFTLQLYWNRAELRIRSEWSKTHRIFRVCGWFGCVTWILAQVDIFAVFGAFSLLGVTIIVLISITFAYFPIVFAIYKSVVAVSAFLQPSSKERFLKLAWYMFLFCDPGNLITIWANLLTELTAFGLMQSIYSLICFSLIITGANGVYYVLKSSLREVEAYSGLPRESSANASSLNKAVRQWRNYAIVLTIVFTLMTIVFVAQVVDLVNALQAGVRSADINLIRADPSKPPRPAAIVIFGMQSLVLIVFCWRSWRTPEGTTTAMMYNQKAGTNGSGTGGRQATSPTSRSTTFSRSPRNASQPSTHAPVPTSPSHARSYTASRFSTTAYDSPFQGATGRSGSTASIHTEYTTREGQTSPSPKESAFTFEMNAPKDNETAV